MPPGEHGCPAINIPSAIILYLGERFSENEKSYQGSVDYELVRLKRVKGVLSVEHTVRLYVPSEVLESAHLRKSMVTLR